MVAAAAQRHLQRKPRVFIQRLKALGLPTHADRHGGTHALRRLHRAHLVQNGKAPCGKGFILLLGEDHEVAVSVVFHHEGAAGAPPLIHFFFHGRPHRRALSLGAGVHEILVVVDHHNGHHRPCFGQRGAHVLQIRHVHPVGGGQHPQMPLALGLGEAAEDAVAPAVPGEQRRVLTLALQQPVGLKVRHHLPHSGLENVVPHLGQPHEQVVGPEYVVAVRVKHHHGRGGKEHIAGLGGVRPAGNALHILMELLLHQLAAAVADIPHQHGRPHLAHRQDRRHLHRHPRKREQQQHIQHRIGSDEFSDLLVHGLPSLVVCGSYAAYADSDPVSF